MYKQVKYHFVSPIFSNFSFKFLLCKYSRQHLMCKLICLSLLCLIHFTKRSKKSKKMCLRYKLKTKLKDIVRADLQSKKYFIKEHFNREKNDEVICDHVVVNLKCQISSRKMEIPIRTQNCEHMQSLGLESKTLVRVATIDTIFNLTLYHCSTIQCSICKKSGLMVQDKFTKKITG